MRVFFILLTNNIVRLFCLLFLVFIHIFFLLLLLLFCPTVSYHFQCSKCYTHLIAYKSLLLLINHTIHMLIVWCYFWYFIFLLEITMRWDSYYRATYTYSILFFLPCKWKIIWYAQHWNESILSSSCQRYTDTHWLLVTFM